MSVLQATCGMKAKLVEVLIITHTSAVHIQQWKWHTHKHTHTQKSYENLGGKGKKGAQLLIPFTEVFV